MPVEISILAGGWSAAQFDFNRLPGIVIGVNEAGLLPQAAIGITMDRLWTEARIGKILSGQASKIWYVRRSAAQNTSLGRAKSVRIFECEPDSTLMINEPGRLNGSSSGMCALNFAFQSLVPYRHEGPPTVYLFGFDCNRSPDGKAYWHEPYPWAPKGATSSGKYKRWAKEYESVARQFAEAGIKVFNMSKTSAITAFPRGPIERIPKACPAK